MQLYLAKSIDNDLFNEALKGLEIFNKELIKRGTPFFSGDKPGMVDLMIWPWCERADIIRILRGDQYVIPRDRFLRLVGIEFVYSNIKFLNTTIPLHV